MPDEGSLRDVLRNQLRSGGLPFREFVEAALYHPDLGYYTQADSPVGKAADFVTAPSLSPVFGFALGRLVREFLGRTGDGMSQIVDIGCGEGGLINTLSAIGGAQFFGVDRRTVGSPARPGDLERRVFPSLAEIPPADARFVLSNELFDAQPFARLVRRGDGLRELTVVERDGELDWGERAAPAPYHAYFEDRGIALDEGQFADVSLDWTALYEEICHFVSRGLIVTFDYGFPQELLFRSRMRRYGTAAAYARHRVSRDLLADPGRQDLTAHINFTDLIGAGERAGFSTLYFDRQAKFLLALGVTEHELFKPIDELSAKSLAAGIELLDQRDEARRLVLPDGIGEEIRVLVQGKGLPTEGWSFQRRLF